MNVLVLNCGSSSLKFQLINTDDELMHQGKDQLLARGVLERIGSQCLIQLEVAGKSKIKSAKPLRHHKDAIEFLLQWLVSKESQINTVASLKDIHAVGHRVVHGGEKFQRSLLIDEKVLQGIEDCIELAPLHNPANISGVKAIKETLGAGVPQVAVFDTAFHSTMPESGYVYAIPYQFYRRYKIRRYGFHGTSHRYIAYRYRKLKDVNKDQVKIITLHLGNGCSVCAIDKGLSRLTSMGMTPLEGLVMGTRAGDVDPAILEYLAHKEGLSLTEVDGILNKQSGLLGLSGLTNDMRELLEEYLDNQDRRAGLAIEVFCQRVRRYLGSYLAHLNGADAIVFSGGIGENSPLIRKKILENLDWLGINVDEHANENIFNGSEGRISTEKSRVEILVIPTNEELLIARDTVRVVTGQMGS